MRGRTTDSPNNVAQINSFGGAECMLSCITSRHFQPVSCVIVMH
jgi:hypothetical protein